MAEKIKSHLGKGGSKEDVTTVRLSSATQDTSRTILTLKQFSRRHPLTTFLVYERISKSYNKETRQRYWKEQRQAIETAVKRHGHSIYTTKQDIAPRWSLDERWALDRLCEIALETGYPILADEITRLIGDKDLHRFPSQQQIQEFLSRYPGVQFVVVGALAKIKRRRTKRGQAATGNKGGRPKKKLSARGRKSELLPRILELRERAYGMCRIGTILGISPTTVRRWCQ